MPPRLTTGLLLTALLLPVPRVHADLFDTARKAARTDIGQADTTGMSIRGGVNLPTGQRGNTTLFKTQSQVGGTCGSFDFRTSMVQAFQELPGLFESLLSEVLSEMPMLLLCYASPTLCDLGKHFQALLNAAIQAKYAQCQQIQMAAMYGGLRLRGGQISQCLEEESNAGHSISEAMKTCQGPSSPLRRPDGGSGTTMDLVRETLQAAGASPETQTLAKGFLGEVTLKSGGGGLQAQNEHPQAAMLARLEAHKAEADGALRAAVAELKATGTVSPQTLEAVSVPGQALPRAALDALAALDGDVARRENLLGKLSTSMAITRLTWDCHQIQDELAAATENNQHLTDEQRRILEKRYESMQRSLLQVMQKTEVLEKHLQPAIDELLKQYTATQDVATKAGLRAPTVTSPQMPYRRQSPSGYSQ
jgi:hypothetical protein